MWREQDELQMQPVDEQPSNRNRDLEGRGKLYGVHVRVDSFGQILGVYKIEVVDQSYLDWNPMTKHKLGDEYTGGEYPYFKHKLLSDKLESLKDMAKLVRIRYERYED